MLTHADRTPGQQPTRRNTPLWRVSAFQRSGKITPVASTDGEARRLTRPREEGEVEIVVRVSESAFRALTKLALDKPSETVGDVAARLIARGLDDMPADI